jgi:3-hydroxyisobutyrate dehydrogenase
MKTIGFIGLGHMGQPMAINLLKAGFAVHVYDVVPDAVKAVAEQGGKAEQRIADMADKCDVIITMVQTGKQVEGVCLGESGIFAHLGKDKLFIDCSSIDIVTTRTLHEEATKRGINMLDAPVSGGVAGATAGTLTMMVGGSTANFERAQPFLNVLGKKIIHAGAPGSGQAAKICNNLLLGISMIGVCEAFTLAEKLGLEPKKFFEISSNASGQCWSMTSYCPVPDIIDNVPSNRHYEPGFMAKMMLKDLRLAQHAAEAVSTAIPIGAVTAELYDLYVNQGHGEKDFSGIINLISGKDI